MNKNDYRLFFQDIKAGVNLKYFTTIAHVDYQNFMKFMRGNDAYMSLKALERLYDSVQDFRITYTMRIIF